MIFDQHIFDFVCLRSVEISRSDLLIHCKGRQLYIDDNNILRNKMKLYSHNQSKLKYMQQRRFVRIHILYI